jgi:hypothetical protein
MTKSIPLFVFILFALLLLAGCVVNTSRKIIKIESEDNQCKYYLGPENLSITYFKDSCGKYQIGDTLK